MIGTGVGIWLESAVRAVVGDLVGRGVRAQVGRRLGRVDGSLLGPVWTMVGASDGSPWQETPT